MKRAHITDTIVRNESYMKVPFSPGSNWSDGLEGTYRDDFDGDGGMDLFELRSEKYFVEDTETVNVPAGTFSTWRLRWEVDAAITESSIPIVDSVVIEVTGYKWWSLGDCIVKDTSHRVATVFIFGNPVLDESWEGRQLVSLTGVDEGQAPEATVGLISANPVRGPLLVSRPAQGRLVLALYDPAGRLALIAQSEGGTEMAIDLGDLAPGVYIARAFLDSRLALAGKIVRAR